MIPVIMSLLGSLLGGMAQEGGTQKTKRTSNLSPTAQAQLQQAQSLAPAGTQIETSSVSDIPDTSSTSSSGSDIASTAMSLLGSFVGQSGQTQSSNISDMKRQQYNQMLQSLMANRSNNQMMKYLY